MLILGQTKSEGVRGRSVRRGGVEAFVFVSDAFDLETALVPRIEDAKCAPFPDCVAKVASSPRWWFGVALV